MGDKVKSVEKRNKINEIDEHIRRNFDIKKVSEIHTCPACLCRVCVVRGPRSLAICTTLNASR